MKKLFAGVILGLGALGIASIIIIVRQRQDAEAMSREIAALRSEMPVMLAHQAVVEQRAQAAERHAQELQVRLVEISAEKVKVATSRLSSAAARSELTQPGMSTAAADTGASRSVEEAEVARLSNLHFSGKVQRQYGPLFRQLNLSPDKASALTQLLIDKKQAAADLAAAAASQGQNPMSDADGFSDLVVATKTDVEEQIKTLLGDDGYAAYRSYGRATGRTNVVTQLRESLVNAGAPLSEDQATQLNQILQKNNVGHLNQKIINQSKSYLSPAQLQVLELQLKEQQAAAKLRNLPPPTIQTGPPRP